MTSDGRSFRLNQAIAKSGLCSRRKADALIGAGRVSVNGSVVDDFARTIDPQSDIVEVDGRRLSFKAFVYVAMYKPRGVVTTCEDERGRRGIVCLLPRALQHLRPVGRLDKNSEGLIIFTNDGQLTQKITHPVHHLPKKYLVTVRGDMKSRDIKQLEKGVMLEDGPTLPAQARLLERQGQATVIELTIREGRNRLIRRMLGHLGYRVSRLLRVSIGGLQLGQMTPGSWRYLSADEIRELEPV